MSVGAPGSAVTPSPLVWLELLPNSQIPQEVSEADCWDFKSIILEMFDGCKVVENGKLLTAPLAAAGKK